MNLTTIRKVLQYGAAALFLSIGSGYAVSAIDDATPVECWQVVDSVKNEPWSDPMIVGRRPWWTHTKSMVVKDYSIEDVNSKVRNMIASRHLRMCEWPGSRMPKPIKTIEATTTGTTTTGNSLWYGSGGVITIKSGVR